MKGINLASGDAVVGMVVVKSEGTLLTVCENGFGKRTQLEDYPVINRGGKGVINIKTTDRNGAVVSVKDVEEENEVMIVSQDGILIRLPMQDVSVIGRNTQGVKLINLGEGDRVIDIARVVNQDDEDDGEREADEEESSGDEAVFVSEIGGQEADLNGQASE